jgi:C-terminal processing protease CtpA/Prc
MNTQYLSYRKILLTLLILLSGSAAGMAADGTIDEVVKFQNYMLTIQASKTPLATILSEIKKKCSIKIVGLEKRYDETITYVSKQGSPEGVLKDFLRHLGEKNYAFEYGNEFLLKIVVLPGGNTDNNTITALSNEKENHPDTVNAVRVAVVIDGSQAQSVGLMQGDIILRYDGLPVASADQLVKATKTKTDNDQVEILVLRENYTLHFILTGGFIGVRISNVSISKEALTVFE